MVLDYGKFGAFVSPLIPFSRHSFQFSRHPLPLESLFAFPMGLIFQQHLQHEAV